MEHQFYYGKKFYLDKKTGYWISSNTPHIRAHVYVWEYHNGPRPPKTHIHHIDKDKSNNNIENLQVVSTSDHIRLHMTPERRAKSAKHMDKIRHLTKKWHASPEGREWHKKNGIKGWLALKEREKKCILCSKAFKTKLSRQIFCSNNCKSYHRRMSRVDDIEKICPVCNKTYIVNKYSLSKTCGRKCGGIFKSKKH